MEIIKFKKLKSVEDIVTSLNKVIPKHITSEDIVFACVGTDRITGDSLGPLVGTALQKRGYTVFGTLVDPMHAITLEDKIKLIPKDKFVIGIDAAIGDKENLHSITVKNRPIKPGAGIGKLLTQVGDISIYGMVAIESSTKHLSQLSLSTVRLAIVMKMADIIVESISTIVPLNNPYLEIATTKYI